MRFTAIKEVTNIRYVSDVAEIVQWSTLGAAATLKWFRGSDWLIFRSSKQTSENSWVNEIE